MNKILFSIVVLFVTNQLSTQPIPEWSSKISSGFKYTSQDNPHIKWDNSGDLILVGSKFDESSLEDILIVKYSSNGTILWQRQFNGTKSLIDKAKDFEIDAYNNIIITGLTYVDSENSDIISLKYNSNGDLKWVNYYSGLAQSVDEGRAITIDSLGMSYVTGSTSLGQNVQKQLLVFRIDTSGNTEWSYLHGSEGNFGYCGEKIKLINQKIQILGSYFDRDRFSNKYIILKLDTNGILNFVEEDYLSRSAQCYYQDNFGNSYLGFGTWERFKVLKIDPWGSIEWSDSIGTQLPSNTSGDEVRAIAVDNFKNVYITGRHYGINAGTSADIITVKYSEDGKRLWVNRYLYTGDNSADIGNAIAVDRKLNVYVAGHSQKRPIGNDYDYVVVKYDLMGNEVGTIRYNGSTNGNDEINSILVDDSSNVFVTGLTIDSTLSSTTTQKYSSLVLVNNSEIKSTPIYLDVNPNPVSTTSTIYFSNNFKELFHFIIFNQNGKIISNQKIKDDTIVISLEHWSTGFYSFILFNDKNFFKGKFVKFN